MAQTSEAEEHGGGDERLPAPGERAATDARAAALGRIAALLMASPRHADMTLRDLGDFLAPAVARGQFALLCLHSGDGQPPVVGAMWWAFVSDGVDRRLSASRAAHLKLEAADWQSGDQPWIVEMLGDRQVLNELIKRVAGKAFPAKPAKLRTLLPDGRLAVGRLERRHAGEKTSE